MLKILKEFSADPILSSYVIDDIWDYMGAMKVRNFCLLACDVCVLKLLQMFEEQ